MGDDNNKTHALNSSLDFYALLGVSESAGDGEIRKAYRQTARKYHPDKVGHNEEALEKFHQLAIAYDVLSDPAVKELYDNARRARQQKAERDRAYEGRRKWMKEDLERRESGVFKRKRDDEEELFDQELRRLAEDGKRRRKEREEQLRKEAEEIELEEKELKGGAVTSPETGGRGMVSDLDRSITLRFPQTESNTSVTKEVLLSRFERFGPIEDAVLREKKIKVDGEKHRRPYTVAVLVFKSIVGAHAAVSDFNKVARANPKDFSMFEAVGWAGGKEPDCIPQVSAPATPIAKQQPQYGSRTNGSDIPKTPPPPGATEFGLRKVPSFGSFRGTPKGTPVGLNSPSLDELTMMRLKNAERRRLEEKIRREEAAASADTSVQQE